jgi:hypothetical protein
MCKTIVLLAGLATLAVCSTAQASTMDRLAHFGHGAVAALAPYHQTTLLITPQGTPVGGAWQKWVDESQVATPPGEVILDVTTGPPSECGSGAQACSTGYAPGQPQETWIEDRSSASQDAYNLYFELGHHFDWTVLTPKERLYLAAGWGQASWPWDDSSAGLQTGNEDGLEGDFAALYAQCAQYGITGNGAIAQFSPLAASSTPDPLAISHIATCSYIDRLGGWSASRAPRLKGALVRQRESR